MRFAIFTHVEHHELEGEFYAYSPYVREMNLWLKFVDEVEIVGPAPQPPKGEQNAEIFYQHSNIKFTKIPYFNLLSLTEIFKSGFKIPFICFKSFKAMSRADHLHLRCPGNVGLIACICQIFFPHKPKTAKYAGNWDPKAKQPQSYKLQKWILANTFLTRNMKVLVYGDWPNQSRNVLPFFTASFSERQIEKIEKDFSNSYKFLFVGNLVPGKQPLYAIRLIEALKERKINAELHIYGDGVLKNELEVRAGNKDYIHVHGNQPLNVVKKAYKQSHFLILASKSEGWPKAVAEAMFFGCIPVVTEVSCVQWMVNYGSRGILAPPAPEGGASNNEWVEEIVTKVEELIKNPEEMKRMSKEAQDWSQEFTLEKFEKAIIEILEIGNVFNNISSSPFGRGRGE